MAVKGRGVSRGSLQPILRDLATERVAMHSQQVGSLSEITVCLEQHMGDELLLELAMRILVADALADHFVDQTFELLPHHGWSSSPVRRRYASRYFSRVLNTTSSRNDGTGGCLFQPISSR